MKSTPAVNLLIVVLVGALTLVCASNARAQSEESEPAPALGKFEAEPLPPPEQPFIVPDVPHSFVERFQMREHWITLRIGASAVFDYSAFQQDANSLAQVDVAGPVRHDWQHGQLSNAHPMGLLKISE